MKDKLAVIQFGQLKGFGPLGLESGNSSNAPAKFNAFISGAIGLMTVIAAIWFIFNIITGAIQIISSGGDKGALENARRKITTGIIGIVVVIASLFIVSTIASLIGLGDIILDPAAIIEQIAPK
jgi:hypothetical protein